MPRGQGEMDMKKGEKRGADDFALSGGSLISKGMYLQACVKMSRSPQPRSRILEVYVEALMGSVSCTGWSQHHLAVSGCVLKNGSPHCGNGGHSGHRGKGSPSPPAKLPGFHSRVNSQACLSNSAFES